jgi:hypothetical protein
MHVANAAQYRVMGGSGAGSGGSFTPDASAVVSAVPLPAAPEAAVAAVAVLAGVALAALGADAPDAAAIVVALVAAGALAPGAVAADGMLAPGGVAEKVLGGNGGRDGAPVDDARVAGALRGGICASRVMLTLDSLPAAAKQVASSILR